MAGAPGTTEWPFEALSERRGELAYALLPLLLTLRSWIDRRVEKIELTSERRARRTVSIDLTIPPIAGELLADPFPLPIAFLEKRPLVRFDLRDEGGGAVPMMTRRQNVLLSRAVLLRLADARATIPNLIPELDVHVLDDLRTIVGADPVAAQLALRNFEHGGGPGSALQRAWIWEDPELRTLLTTLAPNFVLYIWTRCRPGDRRIFKLAYDDEDIRDADLAGQSASRRSLQWLTWQSTSFAVNVPGLTSAHSFHAEVAAPSESTVEVALLSGPLEEPATSEADAGDEGAEGRHFEVAGKPGDICHIYAEGNPLVIDPKLRVRLGLTSRGLAFQAAVIAWATTFILGLGIAVAVAGYQERPAIGAPVLIALPGFFATYLTRSREHAFISQLFRSLRTFLALVAVLSFSAALSLSVVSHGNHFHLKIWIVCAGLAAVLSALLTVTWGVAFRRGRNRAEVSGA